MLHGIGKTGCHNQNPECSLDESEIHDDCDTQLDSSSVRRRKPSRSLSSSGDRHTRRALPYIYTTVSLMIPAARLLQFHTLYRMLALLWPSLVLARRFNAFECLCCSFTVPALAGAARP
eukprot:scaffold233438_cov40-Tisochrysis_lutea.AAC.2